MPPIEFKKLITKANKAGLKATIHSGEDSSAAHIRETIEVLEPLRIGHGIKAIEDPDLIELIKKKDILLEVCPISNWITSAVDDYKAHPVRELFDAGVKINLSTDDPQIFNIDLNDEYLNAYQNWNFTEKEFRQINQWSLDKSFLPKKFKELVKL